MYVCLKKTNDRYWEAMRKYEEKFGWLPLAGFPQFKTNDEAIAAMLEAIETDVEIIPEYEEGIIY